MNKTIKIGFLFPYSSIFPNMSQDIIDGFYSVISEPIKNRFQFYPEYVDLGQTENIKTAINKLMSFHRVDILSGIISYKLLPEIVQLIGWRKKLAFFFDMGENLPPTEPIPAPVFTNSAELWQQEYALGNWAQKTFKGKGAILMSTYDAGYQLHSSFWQGAIEAGAEEIDMHILPYSDEISKSITPILPSFFEKIERANVNFLHALFCGNETFEFYNAYRNSSLYNKIPLVVTPHMATQEILKKIETLSISCYTTSGWDFSAEDSTQQSLIKNYESSFGKQSSIFAILGMEAGIAINEILPELEKEDIDNAAKILKNNTFKGPRGLRNFNLHKPSTNSSINIEKLTSQSLGISRLMVGEVQTEIFNSSSINAFHSQSESGWNNPYLCV